jgi:hypothetical protein
MSIRSFLLRELAVGALALLGCVVIGRGAEASTIYTYSFVQTDYFYNVAGFFPPSIVTGGFTGTADALDHIHLDTLSDFHVDFDGHPGPGLFYEAYSGLPDYFSFQIGDNGGTLAFQSPLRGVLELCVGEAVITKCGSHLARGVLHVASASPYDFAASGNGPVVTLVSAVSSSPVATTPIPGALLLFGTALGGLGAAGAWRRKPAAA